MRRAVAGERPELLDLVGLDPHHAGADGRGEKLVQAGAEVIAMQVGDLEVEQAERMRAVGDDLDVMGVSHVGDFGHGHGLAHPVDHVRDMDQPRARSYGLLRRP